MPLLFCYPGLSPGSSAPLQKVVLPLVLTRAGFSSQSVCGWEKGFCPVACGNPQLCMKDSWGRSQGHLLFKCPSVNLGPTFLLTAQFRTCNSWLPLAFRSVRCGAVLFILLFLLPAEAFAVRWGDHVWFATWIVIRTLRAFKLFILKVLTGSLGWGLRVGSCSFLPPHSSLSVLFPPLSHCIWAINSKHFWKGS